jgi:hypothetical protein
MSADRNNPKSGPSGPLQSPEYYARMRRSLPDNLTEIRKDFKKTEQSLDDLSGGYMRTSGEFDVATGAASTTVVHYGIGSRSVILLMPLDSTTALEYALGTTWVVPAQGQFVVNHPNNGSARSYRYVFFSGRLNP